MPEWLLPAAIAGAGSVFSGLSAARERRKRQERIDSLFREIESNRQRRKAEVTEQIGTYTAGLRKSGEARAARMALASGREGTATALAPVITGRVARAGSNALESALTSIDQQADQQKMNVEFARADEPIEPGVFDYLGEITRGAGRFVALQGLQDVEAQRVADEGVRDWRDNLTDEINRDVTEPFVGDKVQELGYLRRDAGRARRANRFNLYGMDK